MYNKCVSLTCIDLPSTHYQQMLRMLELCPVYTMMTNTCVELSNDRIEARFRFMVSLLMKIALSETVYGADNTTFYFGTIFTKTE